MNDRSIMEKWTMDRSLSARQLRCCTSKRKEPQQQTLCETSEDDVIPDKIQSCGSRSLHRFDRASSSRSLKAFRKERINKESESFEDAITSLRSRFAKERELSASTLGSNQSFDSLASLLRRMNCPARVPTFSDSSTRTIDSIDLRINQLQNSISGLTITTDTSMPARSDIDSHDDISVLSMNEAYLDESHQDVGIS